MTGIHTAYSLRSAVKSAGTRQRTHFNFEVRVKFHRLLLLCFAASLTASPILTLAQNTDPAPMAPAPSQNAQAAPQAPQFPPNYKPALPMRSAADQGSTYIPMDSWMYPALDRLSSMGFLDTAFFGLRPWTRLSVARMLEASADKVNDSGDENAQQIFLALQKEVGPDAYQGGHSRRSGFGVCARDGDQRRPAVGQQLRVRTNHRQ